MQVHIHSKKDYIMYMGKYRIYGSNVEIITTKIYEVCHYLFLYLEAKKAKSLSLNC
jgi:hypothetical protein